MSAKSPRPPARSLRWEATMIAVRNAQVVPATTSTPPGSNGCGADVADIADPSRFRSVKNATQPTNSSANTRARDPADGVILGIAGKVGATSADEPWGNDGTFVGRGGTK